MDNPDRPTQDVADVAGQLAARLKEIFGKGDPRLSQWRDLCAEVAG